MSKIETKLITPKDYAELKGCGVPNITKHIRDGNTKRLPFVHKVHRFYRFYLLEVPNTICTEDFISLAKGKKKK